MKKKDFTFSEKIKLCNDLGTFLSELNSLNKTNYINKSTVNNLLDRLGHLYHNLIQEKLLQLI